MKTQLQESINNEVLVLKKENGKLSTSVGILVELYETAMQLKKANGVDKIKRINQYIMEDIPYENVLKISTGQKVLTRHM